MQNKQPNILLFITDQQRGDCIGVDGHPVLMTPNMDEIALNGTRFRRAYATCPSCIAARRSILTGQHPATHGMVGFQDGVEFFPAATLPGELGKHGYQTFMVGRSMHQYPHRKRYGYDHMVLVDDIEPKPDSHEQEYAHGLTGNGWTARPWHMGESYHPTVRTADEAIRFLTQWRDPSVPYFLTVSFLAPHPPLSPPPFYMDRYLRMELPKPVIGQWAEAPDGTFGVDSDRVDLKNEALKSCHAAYYGLINHVDDQICRVFRALGVDPVTGTAALDDTVIIFTSDHGEMLGDHHLFRKCYPYEGSARIPFLIRGPGVKTASVCDEPVCLEDIMPTVLDMAGVPIPDSVDGRSLVPLLHGESIAWRDFLHGEHATCYGEHQANHYLTDGREKYIWYSHSGREQLFDLFADPMELDDLAIVPDYSQHLAMWRNRLAHQLADRTEGFSDGYNLIAGRSHRAVLPAAEDVGVPVCV